jgi:hypothetical protein
MFIGSLYLYWNEKLILKTVFTIINNKRKEGGSSHDGGHVLEAVDPLFPLRPLAAHVEELEVEPLAEIEK